MELGQAGLDIVGFRYEGEKYCKECFRQIETFGQRVRFSRIFLAVQVQSCIKNCKHCGKDLVEWYYLQKESSNG
jgi:hypothetical protein